MQQVTGVGEPQLLNVALRSRNLPVKMMRMIQESIEEAQTIPGIHPLEVAAVRAYEPDASKRKLLYGALLGYAKPGPARPTKRGARSVEGEVKQIQKKHRPEACTSNGSSVKNTATIESPLYRGYLLVGDSNLRNLAAQELNLKQVKDKDGHISIGCCRGGSTMREITALLRRLPSSRSLIVMGGVVDAFMGNKLDTILRDAQILLDALQHFKHTVLITPPIVPVVGSDFGVKISNKLERLTEMIEMQTKTLANVTLLKASEFLKKEPFFEPLRPNGGLRHLSPQGLQVLFRTIKNAIRGAHSTM